MMAAADCGMCELLGFRSCDVCGNPVFTETPGEKDLCVYCISDEGR